MIIRTIRDIFTSEIDTIWIDEPAAFERAQDFLRVVMPRFVNRLKLYDEKVPLFHKYGIEEEIAKIQRRHVPLPEGGSIVIDQTEALVAIDVNSGNFRVEDDAERTAYEMNLRAAREIARQLRLRDLGGVIVNDFIDMREERHRRGVERALRDAIKRDRARTKVLRMSAFGLIEMTRQRIRPSLKRSIYQDCPQCSGAGVVKTAESMAIDVMRLLALATHRDEIRRIAIAVNPSVATYLNNRKRKEIARMEPECNMTIQIGVGGRRARPSTWSSSASTPTATRSGCNPSRRPHHHGHGHGHWPSARAIAGGAVNPCLDADAAGRPATTIVLDHDHGPAHPALPRRPTRTAAMTFQPASGYPLHRPRRLRGHPRLREMVSENRLAVDDLIYPLFVYHGKGLRREIPSMPGQYQLSLDRLGEAVAEAAELGIPAILLFGIPEHKDARGSAALRDDGIVQQAIGVARQAAPGLLVITDLCFCEYTDHGHCGPLAESGGRMDVDNDATLPLLAEQAVSHARAGADVIAPSGMMDGMVQAIRRGLDDGGVPRRADPLVRRQVRQRLLRPVPRGRRERPSFGDRRSYQMDPANSDEAIREVALDLAEGADMIMVKPALAYLDIIRRVKETYRRPAGGVQRLGRVRHGQGRRGQRLDRRAADRARDPHRHQARRRRHDPHLPRARRGAGGCDRADECAISISEGADRVTKPFDSTLKELVESASPVLAEPPGSAVPSAASRSSTPTSPRSPPRPTSSSGSRIHGPGSSTMSSSRATSRDCAARRVCDTTSWRDAGTACPYRRSSSSCDPRRTARRCPASWRRTSRTGRSTSLFEYNVVGSGSCRSTQILAGDLATLPLAPISRVSVDGACPR